MEEVAEEKGVFQLWLLTLALIPAADHWAFLQHSLLAPGFLLAPSWHYCNIVFCV